MLRKLKQYFKNLKKNDGSVDISYKGSLSVNEYVEGGMVPWSKGYEEFKIKSIKKNIYDKFILDAFQNRNLSSDYGFRLDERIIEYPWILAKLKKGDLKLLDAGSTFNFEYIVNHPLISTKNLTIYTFAPEANSFHRKGISYMYGDLRDLPFKDSCFDVIVCQSTLEHIDMDNSIYGYDLAHNSDIEKKSFEFLKVINEFKRTLSSNGQLLITVPYGKFENHGFFQQFDKEMTNLIFNELKIHGKLEVTYFKYLESGWIFANEEQVTNCISHNPHTGKGVGMDSAAHSRGLICIEFIKN